MQHKDTTNWFELYMCSNVAMLDISQENFFNPFNFNSFRKLFNPLQKKQIEAYQFT